MVKETPWRVNRHFTAVILVTEVTNPSCARESNLHELHTLYRTLDVLSSVLTEKRKV